MAHKLLFFIIVIAGFTACKTPEARRPVQQSGGSFIDQSIERNKKLLEQEADGIQAIIKADSSNNYIASDSGFWYYYQVKDSTNAATPTFGDFVSFNYSISDINGTEIISAEEIGLQEIYIDQTNQDLISGVREGVKLLKEGEQATFLFPSYKAYGYYGLENKIGANIPIKSTITLNKLEQKQ